MPEKSHWPFGGDPWNRSGKGRRRDQGTETTKNAESERATPRQHGRADRLIVGGRAHVKKSGLS
jgi:hypothetical protein